MVAGRLLSWLKTCSRHYVTQFTGSLGLCKIILDILINPGYDVPTMRLMESKMDIPKPKDYRATDGYISYCYWGLYGWIYVGATDNEDALIQAQRSTSEIVDINNLYVWRNEGYEKVV